MTKTKRPSLKNLDVIIATWFGSGYIKPAPGTWGTICALPFAVAIHIHLGPIALAIAAIVAYFLGVWSAGQYSGRTQSHDASEIVIDEVAGVWVTLAMAPMTGENLVIGFLLFRLFDILKPFPISFIDKNVKGGAGIMLDDMVAGAFAGICLLVLHEWGIVTNVF
ncbi:phosphatidylglycerophosphatase A family protein [Curvivirga aplysinae]|uniref:phosphatidylglycerophosphatase A family protein n=1 Tax=Curvivirga aplysinae TaxID=2529852 RepID=UPI0012BC5F06|nr:phosphatidylglycerophosphatase A [Curvivirga aplysinae]MTI10070.1 phosphatidylglycerophosphatase A [Curvivirga aplysinae]